MVVYFDITHRFRRNIIEFCPPIFCHSGPNMQAEMDYNCINLICISEDYYFSFHELKIKFLWQSEKCGKYLCFSYIPKTFEISNEWLISSSINILNPFQLAFLFPLPI